MTLSHRTAIFSILIGTILEWYDFSLLGSLAPIIGALFFPSESQTLSLLATFGVFATGFIARPIGGMLFGHIGDRYGRKNALSLTILLMGIPTTLIGLLPTFHTAGVLAPLLLILLRIIQGMAASGEYPGAICFLTEIAPPNKRGLYGSLSMLGVAGGIFLGSLINFMLSASLSASQIYAWGWRIPFMLGIPLSFIGWFLRYKTQETKAFNAISAPKYRFPLQEMIQLNGKNALNVIAFFSLSTVSFYMGFIYITSYLINMHKISLSQGFFINAISTMTLAVLIPLFGYFSDKINRKILMMIGAASLLIFFYPIFILFSQGNPSSLLLGQLILAFILSLFTGPLAAMTAENFSTTTRYTGTSTGVNIGASLFGGTCPFIATYLVQQTGSDILPCLYPMIFALLCLFILFRVALPKKL